MVINGMKKVPDIDMQASTKPLRTSENLLKTLRITIGLEKNPTMRIVHSTIF